MFRAIVVGAVAICAFAATERRAVAGTPVNWNGGTGVWSDDSAWDLTLVPDNNGATYDVAIGGGADDVSLDLSVTVDTVNNAGTLRLLDGTSLTLAQPGGLTNTGTLSVNHAGTSILSGTLNNDGFTWVESGTLSLDSDLSNDGTFWIGDGSFAGNNAALSIANDLTLGGTGELYFASFAINSPNRPSINVPLGRTVTNSADHRIHGGSGVIQGMGTLVNNGLIDADVPLRTLMIDTDQFSNQGNLWARSGNLAVDVDSWTNSGIVRVTSGSASHFTGSLLVNDAGARIESLGGANLRLSNEVTNFGTIATGGSGRVTFDRANALIANLPNGVIDATAGTVRFEGTNSFIQNFGEMRGSQGTFEFVNGTDMFGGELGLSNSSAARVQAGTTSMTQVRTTLDSSSRLEVSDRGTGIATLNYNGVLTNNGGTIAAISDTGGTATFNLNGEIFGANGFIVSNGGDINIANATMVEGGIPSLEIRNAGDISFNNVDSTAAGMLVNWLGTGGDLEFTNYRKQGNPTSLNLQGWTATGGNFLVSGGSVLTGHSMSTLPANTTLTVSGTGSSLTIAGMTQTAAGSLVDLVSGGTFAATNLTANGDVRFQGGTFDGDLSLNPSSVFTVQSGTNVITGDLTWSGDRTVELASSSTRLGINGALPVAAGSGLRLVGNATRFEGGGMVTNSGLIEGGAPSNNNSTYWDIDLVNNADGVVRAFQNGGATGTFMRFSSDINNAGLMESDATNMYFTGASVTNTGTIQAVNDGLLTFVSGATVNNGLRGGFDGDLSADGPNSLISIESGSVVSAASLTLTNDADLTVRDAGTDLSLGTPLSVTGASLVTVFNSGSMSAPSIDLDGRLTFSGGSDASPNTVAGAVALTDVGQIDGTSGVLRLTGPVTTSAGSVVDLSGSGTHLVVDGTFHNVDGATITSTAYSTNSTIIGSGTLTNDGLIEVMPSANNQFTYLDADLVNSATGVIRSQAFDGTITASTLELRDNNIDNAGIIEADGQRIYFDTVAMTNSGAVQAVNGGLIRFEDNAVVTDAGGSLSADGAGGLVEVFTGANVAFSTFSLTNGSTGTISGTNSSLTAATTVAQGSSLSVVSTGRLAGPSAQIDGSMTLQSSAVVDAPVTISPTGQVTANSSTVTMNGDVLIQNDGMGGSGRMSLLSNSVRINGAGAVTNSGLIEGGAITSNNDTYLDLDIINNADGVVRAFQNGTATGTDFELSGSITNAGLMEGVGGDLVFRGATVNNSGAMQAVSHASGSSLQFLSATTVTDAGGTTTIDGPSSTLEVSGGSVADLGTLTLSNGATGFVSGGGSEISGDITIDQGSRFEVRSSSRISGAGVRADGEYVMTFSTFGDAPVTVGPTGVMSIENSQTTNRVTHSADITIENDGMGGAGSLLLNRDDSYLDGTGTVFNSGLIESSVPNTSNNAYLTMNLVNNADGVVRATRSAAQTNTRFRMPGTTVDNAGLMEADGSILYFQTTQMTNSGTLRAIDNAGPSELEFVSGAMVTDAGGATEIDGATSLLEVSGGSNVNLGQLTFRNGGGGFVSGTNSVVTGDTTIEQGSTFRVQSSGRLSGVHAQVDGQLNLQSGTMVDAPITVGATGQVLADSGITTVNAPVTVMNDGMGGQGRISILGNSQRINGSGVITNSGLIEGGAISSGNSTYLDNALVNNADGTVRAFRNGTPIGTYFRLSSDNITNAGTMEADGAFLYFDSATMQNSGTLRTIDNPDDDSKLIFANNSVVTDAGGTTTLDGPRSFLEVSGSSNVALGQLSFLNGAGGFVSGTNDVVTADTTIGQGSSFEVRSSARLNGAHAQVDGRLTVQSSGRVGAPVTVGETGEIVANSSSAFFDGAVTVDAAARGLGDGGTVSITGNSARLGGTGLITNSGLIQGGAPSIGNTTFLDSAVVNTPDGVIRAFSNNGATSTSFFMPSAAVVTNQGMMEADGGQLFFPNGSVVDNTGTIRALNGSTVYFDNGAKVSGTGMLHILDTGIGIIEDGTTRVEANTFVDQGGSLTVRSSAELSGSAANVNGLLNVQGFGRLKSPVNVGMTGQILADSSFAYFDGDVTIQGDGIDAGRLSILASGAQVDGLGDIENFGVVEGGSVTNNGTTYLHNEITNRSTGVLRAFSNNGATNTTFLIDGNIVNEGLMQADGATMSLSNIFVDNSAGSWEAINGGRLQVNASFVGGASGSNTLVDGDASMLELINGSLVGFDSLTLTNGGDVSVSGTNSSLAIIAPFSIGANSVATVGSFARLQAGGVTVGDMGLLHGQGGRIVSSVQVNSGGRLEATSGTTIVDGSLTIDGGGLGLVTNSSVTLTVNGAVNNAVGGAVRLNSNTTAMNGSGMFTNDGLLEGGAFNNSNTVTLAKSLNNTGSVVATSNSGATGTSFQLTSPFIGNSGTMTAQDANLIINGSTVDHSGVMRAENGNFLRFQSSAMVNNSARGGLGDVEVDGNASLLDVQTSSNVSIGSLTLSNGGDTSVSSSATLNVATPYTVGADSVLTVDGFGTLSGGGITVANVMNAGASTVNAATTVGPTGEVFITSSSGAMFDAPVTLQNDGGGNSGRLTFNNNSAWMRGAGTVDNSGVIESALLGNGQSSFLDNDVVNNADGVIRAMQNSGTSSTNTFFQLRGDINNAGLMEADGANLYFTGSTGQNSGTIRAVDHVDGSKLIFLGGAQLTDVGGITEVDGATSALEVSGGANVGLGTLSLTNGATGFVTGTSTTLSADMTIASGSTFTVQGNATLGGPGVQVDGTLNVDQATISGPTTLGPAGMIQVNSSSGAAFNAAVGVANGAQVMFDDNSAFMYGTGTVTNDGLIEARVPSSGNSVFLDNPIVNNGGGVIRAAQNTGTSATNTYFQIRGSVTNSGMMEANGANLYFTNATVQNGGTIRAMSHASGSKLFFLNGTQLSDTGTGVGVVDGSTSTMEVSGNADVAFNSLTFSNNAVGTVTGSGSSLTSGIDINAGSTLTVTASAQLTVAAGGMNNNGTLTHAAGTTFVANGPVVTGAGSAMNFASGMAITVNASLTIDGILDSGNNLADVNGDMSFGANGRLRALAGGTMRVSGDISNSSTQRTDFDSVDLLWNLDASNNAGDPQLLEVGGDDLGDSLAGLTNNFALGTLFLSGADQFVTLTDNADNAGDGVIADALYVATLTISDLDSRLLLNGLNLYYQTFNGDLSQIDTSLGGAFIQLTTSLVPEPASLLLVVLGGACVVRRRRRA